MITRSYDLNDLITPGKVLILYGPRQVGKTTLLQDFLGSTHLKYKLESGDDINFQKILGSQSISVIQNYAQGYDLIAIDEAQRIPNVGLGLKILVDHVPNIAVIATGSASFDLSYKIGEPLVGRSITKILYPVAQSELLKQQGQFDLTRRLEDFLIFGSYPSVLTMPTREQKTEYLRNIIGSYLLKDILEVEKVKRSQVLLDLLKLIAFQLGSEVSLSELGANLGLDRKTVARYLNLLEQSFIIVNLRGYSGNLRSEITRKSKYFFIDNGIRNAIVSNFNVLDTRDDIGKLWENFLISERLKKQQYAPVYSNNYFWRTWEQKEIDWVEEREGSLFTYEFKYKDPGPKYKPPKEFKLAYPNSHFELIYQGNYPQFIS